MEFNSLNMSKYKSYMDWSKRYYYGDLLNIYKSKIRTKYIYMCSGFSDKSGNLIYEGQKVRAIFNTKDGYFENSVIGYVAIKDACFGICTENDEVFIPFLDISDVRIINKNCRHSYRKLKRIKK